MAEGRTRTSSSTPASGLPDYLACEQSDDSDPDNDAADVDVMVRLDDEDLEQTRIPMRLHFRGAAQRGRVVVRYDVADGTTQTLQRPDRFLQDLRP